MDKVDQNRLYGCVAFVAPCIELLNTKNQIYLSEKPYYQFEPLYLIKGFQHFWFLIS